MTIASEHRTVIIITYYVARSTYNKHIFYFSRSIQRYRGRLLLWCRTKIARGKTKQTKKSHENINSRWRLRRQSSRTVIECACVVMIWRETISIHDYNKAAYSCRTVLSYTRSWVWLHILNNNNNTDVYYTVMLCCFMWNRTRLNDIMTTWYVIILQMIRLCLNLFFILFSFDLCPFESPKYHSDAHTHTRTYIRVHTQRKRARIPAF